MTTSDTELERALGRLLQSDTDQLYAELGLRQKAIQTDASQAGLFETTATFDAPFAGPLDVLRDFGRTFFDRFSKDAYSLVCGVDPETKAEREKVLKAFGGTDAALAAALTASLMSWFGWAPAIAAVVAALIVRLFFKNAHATACAVWKKHLPA